jgi:hypothetical protein
MCNISLGFRKFNLIKPEERDRRESEGAVMRDTSF